MMCARLVSDVDTVALFACAACVVGAWSAKIAGASYATVGTATIIGRRCAAAVRAFG
jgi:hypothetical protein